jgi:thiamine-phosphate pyrophosphorylase
MPTDKRSRPIRWDLYVITDEGLGGGRTHEQQAQAALAGGAGVIQVRDKMASTRRLYEAAGAIREMTRAAGALLIVNDRLDIALAAEADGLHVGPDDLPVAVARRLLRPGMILGASAGTVEEAVEAERAGADYLGVGAVYEARASKADAGPPVGPERVRQVRAAVQIPIVGIGGVKAENATPVIVSGADGVAVITGIVAAADIRAAAEQYVAIVDDAKRRGGRA